MFKPDALAPPVPMLSPSPSSSESQAVPSSSSTSPPTHAIVVVLVAVGILRVWLSRARELGELTTDSQCRDIAENGLYVTLIC